MKISVLGTGMVGHALATKLVALGHEVMMAGRERSNEKAQAWAASNKAQSGNYQDAGRFGDMIVIATLGSATLEVAKLAGADALAGKIILDVTNPLDMSAGFPPTLIEDMTNTSSLGEQLQAALPSAHVVKALNTMNCDVMVDPARVPGDHDVFYCGNDQRAKETVATLLKSFGWTNPVDLGPIEAARGTEGLMNFWLRMYGAVGHADFNYKIVRAER
ncbi:MAG: NAD(P)-binding domain-containing protein [Pseudomonadota bacterium]